MFNALDLSADATPNVPLIVLTLAGLMLVIEQLKPAHRRSWSGNWWLRAGLLNSAQAAVALIGACTWDLWFADTPLANRWQGNLVSGVLCGYLLITFVYYWWHRARHSIGPLWSYLHRLHHSPKRIEVITSFYKHPLELLANGLLSSALLFLLLGLPPAAVAFTVLITGVAELFYHWNISTPRWLGWFIQRPEMHRVHHERGVHTNNFSDLPLWDALFGTLHNPKTDVVQCGFPEEHKLTRLLLGKRVQEG